MNEAEVLRNEIASMQKQLNGAFKRINELVAEKDDLLHQLFEEQCKTRYGDNLPDLD
jgi:uncharacterized coiled-coil DUF342 family protein|tara:strand:+ start:150 stop:320 length:171 start_codon:yes stop_codon:yes gene_type:complete